MFSDAPVSTRAHDISFPAILAVRCRGDVLASGGISFSSSSVKVTAGNEALGAKVAIVVLNFLEFCLPELVSA